MKLEITKFVKWKFWLEVGGSYRVVAEDSCLLGCCAMSASKQLWMFQKYKGPFTSVSMDCLTVKMEALQSFQNICNYLTVDMACCSRRHPSSFTIIPPKKEKKIVSVNFSHAPLSLLDFLTFEAGSHRLP
jgi:hypothetical protein